MIARFLFGHLQDIGDRNTDFFALNHDFTARDRPVVGQDPDLVVLSGVEFDDGTAAHAQELLHRQDGLAKHD